jgi:hypothetical protein
METEDDLLAVTPINQTTSDETPAHDDTDCALLQVEHGSTSAMDTGDNVSNQPMATETLELLTGPSSPTATPSALDDDSPASCGESEERLMPLAPSPADRHVPSAENHDDDSPASSGESEERLTRLSPSPADRHAPSAENNIVAERIKEIKRRRREAAGAQACQAERMVKRSRVDLRPGEQGDNVAVPVPLVDRGRGDPRNILGVIIDRREDTDQYRIAVKAGVLNGMYSRNQFDLCPQRLLNTEDINTEKTVSLRSAVISESSTGGQGFIKCNCTGAQKCRTRRCKCLKAGLHCNSRCHSSLNCCNK